MESKPNEHNQAGKNQLVGNIGLYYACYELSKRGWNAMPTSRNAIGIDIVIYDKTGSEAHTIQVKTLSKRSPVPLGGKLTNLIAEYMFIVVDAFGAPILYILGTEEVRRRVHEGIKGGKKSYWLKPKEYEGFKDKWDKIRSKTF